MIKRWLCTLLSAVMTLSFFPACGKADKEIKIGVSFGVGGAQRWIYEKQYMEEKAAELGVQIEVRLNNGDTANTQEQDCRELIGSGIDVLILTPRDADTIDPILSYAKEKNVPIVSYSRIVPGKPVDLLVGYDSTRIGQKLGQYLSEMVDKGSYIILRGPESDNNAVQLYDGAMRYLEPIQDQIDILLDAPVPMWSPDEAKKMVTQALKANGNKVDAILAPNDRIAGACAQALEELGITQHVAITGMGAELSALRRIAAGTQDVTFYLDFQKLAHTAVEEAVHIVKREKVNVNAPYDNQDAITLDACLFTGQLITKNNIGSILIDSGYCTYDEIYGTGAQGV